MRDCTPETKGVRVASLAGLPVPAPPFAQRVGKITEASPPAKPGIGLFRLKRVQKCEELVLRFKATDLLSIIRLDPGQRRFLEREVRMKVNAQRDTE
ncbi:hypothetical protein [Sphingobium phenoxybenzoativorans]|uniref:hypothetical protein n=1 Tax=Sphingobium phenoxybenzoativorans TaxID=1592790 RepID=UPI000872EF87|nr:hypothetical protein [Sphingobium phenoxybenzoativorans]